MRLLALSSSIRLARFVWNRLKLGGWDRETFHQIVEHWHALSKEELPGKKSISGRMKFDAER